MYLLKFATIIGMGRVIHRTPQIAQRDPTTLPAAVVGATSPYPAIQEHFILGITLLILGRGEAHLPPIL